LEANADRGEDMSFADLPPGVPKWKVTMTLRQAIVRQKRRASVATYGGFALFAVAIVLGVGGPPVLAVALPGFMIAMVGVVWLLLFIRCPSCRAAIGYTVSCAGNPFSLPPKIRFCPCCGVALDSELGEKK
jgi:hypothetical protein